MKPKMIGSIKMTPKGKCAVISLGGTDLLTVGLEYDKNYNWVDVVFKGKLGGSVDSDNLFSHQDEFNTVIINGLTDEIYKWELICDAITKHIITPLDGIRQEYIKDSETKKIKGT